MCTVSVSAVGILTCPSLDDEVDVKSDELLLLLLLLEVCESS